MMIGGRVWPSAILISYGRGGVLVRMFICTFRKTQCLLTSKNKNNDGQMGVWSPADAHDKDEDNRAASNFKHS